MLFYVQRLAIEISRNAVSAVKADETAIYGSYVNTPFLSVQQQSQKCTVEDSKLKSNTIRIIEPYLNANETPEK